jgi:chromosome partitioning protein
LSRVFATTNQKGGVGKTTTAINLAASLAANDLRVLVVDNDPQGNATSGLGVAKDFDRPSTYHLLLEEPAPADLEIPTAFDGLFIIPADKNLAGANLDLVDLPQREFRLRNGLSGIRDKYDFVIIDCPPALDLLTLNALIAADAVVVPIQCEFFALEGISELMDTIGRIRDAFNHSLEIAGILLTMYDDRTNLTRQVAADLREFFQHEVFRTIIPRSIRLAEAPSFGKPILSYDPRSKGAECYIQLAKEILDREQARKRAQSAR